MGESKEEIKLMKQEIKMLMKHEKIEEKLLIEMQDFSKERDVRGEKMRKQAELLNMLFKGIKPKYKNQESKERIKEYFDFISKYGKNFSLMITKRKTIELEEDLEPIALLSQHTFHDLRSLHFTPSEKGDVIIFKLINKKESDYFFTNNLEFDTLNDWLEYSEMTEQETLEKLKNNSLLREFKEEINFDFFNKGLELGQETAVEKFEKIVSYELETIREESKVDTSKGYSKEVIEYSYNIVFNMFTDAFEIEFSTCEADFLLDGYLEEKTFLNPENHKFLISVNYGEIL